MDVKKLPISVLRIRTDPLPVRQLELSCEIANPMSFDIYILDAWLRIESPNGLKFAEGRLFHSIHSRAEPSILTAGQKISGAITFQLPSIVLQHIEERRAGGDVILRGSSQVWISQVYEQNGIKLLGAPFETFFDSWNNSYFEYTIPQSEWIKILKGLAWSELELLELPVTKMRSNPILTRALQRFEDAQDCYRRGDWDESMVNCRKVFEAFIKDATGVDDLSIALQAFQALISEPKKANHINNIVKELTPFLHIARHEQQPPIPIKPADAQLALHLTGTILAYLGG